MISLMVDTREPRRHIARNREATPAARLACGRPSRARGCTLKPQRWLLRVSARTSAAGACCQVAAALPPAQEIAAASADQSRARTRPHLDWHALHLDLQVNWARCASKPSTPGMLAGLSRANGTAAHSGQSASQTKLIAVCTDPGQVVCHVVASQRKPGGAQELASLACKKWYGSVQKAAERGQLLGTRAISRNSSRCASRASNGGARGFVSARLCVRRRVAPRLTDLLRKLLPAKPHDVSKRARLAAPHRQHGLLVRVAVAIVVAAVVARLALALQL